MSRSQKIEVIAVRITLLPDTHKGLGFAALVSFALA
jgi:hypothetical protein